MANSQHAGPSELSLQMHQYRVWRSTRVLLLSSILCWTLDDTAGNTRTLRYIVVGTVISDADTVSLSNIVAKLVQKPAVRQ